MEGTKVLHCADLHFDDEPGRLQNTVECCDRIIETAQVEVPRIDSHSGRRVRARAYPGFSGDARGD